MLRHKKGQGLPVNVIIIAVIALVVLVVLIAIFTGRVRIFSENLQSCVAKQGKCEPGPLCPTNKALILNTDCTQGQVCCIQVLT